MCSIQLLTTSVCLLWHICETERGTTNHFPLCSWGGKGANRGGRLEWVSCRNCLSYLIYPLLSLLLGIRHYFHVVLLNTMWPYLLVSPQTTIASSAAPVCTAPDWTEKVHWSSVHNCVSVRRHNAELRITFIFFALVHYLFHHYDNYDVLTKMWLMLTWPSCVHVCKLTVKLVCGLMLPPAALFRWFQPLQNLQGANGFLHVWASIRHVGLNHTLLMSHAASGE